MLATCVYRIETNKIRSSTFSAWHLSSSVDAIVSAINIVLALPATHQGKIPVPSSPLAKLPRLLAFLQFARRRRPVIFDFSCEGASCDPSRCALVIFASAERWEIHRMRGSRIAKSQGVDPGLDGSDIFEFFVL